MITPAARRRAVGVLAVERAVGERLGVAADRRERRAQVVRDAEQERALEPRAASSSAAIDVERVGDARRSRPRCDRRGATRALRSPLASTRAVDSTAASGRVSRRASHTRRARCTRAAPPAAASRNAGTARDGRSVCTGSVSTSTGSCACAGRACSGSARNTMSPRRPVTVSPAQECLRVWSVGRVDPVGQREEVGVSASAPASNAPRPADIGDRRRRRRCASRNAAARRRAGACRGSGAGPAGLREPQRVPRGSRRVDARCERGAELASTLGLHGRRLGRAGRCTAARSAVPCTSEVGDTAGDGEHHHRDEHEAAEQPRAQRRTRSRSRASSRRRVEAVADAAHGRDRHRVAELLAHLRDVHVDGARVAEPVVAPHAVEDLLARRARGPVARRGTAAGRTPSSVNSTGVVVDAHLAPADVDRDAAGLHDLGAPAPPSTRRSTAFTRATSSAGENGLVR